MVHKHAHTCHLRNSGLSLLVALVAIKSETYKQWDGTDGSTQADATKRLTVPEGTHTANTKTYITDKAHSK